MSFTLLSIRGIGTDNFIPSADPSIATYVDGIYVPLAQGTAQSLGNVKHVEVLKGPQGTLFGRNATGGAISIITEEPGDEFRANVEGEVGNFNHYSGKLNFSGPVTSWLSAGVSGLYSRRDDYYSNVNYDVQPTDVGAVRAKLNFHPLENFSIGLTGLHTVQHGTNSIIGKNTRPTLLGTVAGIQAQPDDYRAVSDLKTSGVSRQEIVYGNLVWNTSLFDLKLLGGVQNIKIGPIFIDFDGSPLPLAVFDTTNEIFHIQTGELQIVSNDSTPWAEHFKWVAGLYYLHSLAGFDPAHLRVGPQAFTSLTNVLGLPIPPGITNLVTSIPGLGALLGDQGLSLQFSGVLGTDAKSAYVQGTYTFTDWLDLTVGGRVQQEKRFLTKSTTGVNNPLVPDAVIPALNFALPSHTSANFSPKAVLGLHPADDQPVYASYSVGFKSGTYNVVNIYTAPNYIVPERVTSYEIGAKLEFLDGRLRVNGAIFDNEIHNLQTGFVSVLSGGAVQFLTALAARTRGAEIEGTFIPFPELDAGLALSGNFAYLSTKYTNFQNGVGFNPTTGIYQANVDNTGNQIVRAPKESGDIGVVQTFDTSQGTYKVAVGEYYNSGYFYDAENTVKENSYTLLNARVSYPHNPWHLRVTAYGKNLLDRQYHIQRFQTDFGQIDTLAAPLEFGLRLNWEF